MDSDMMRLGELEDVSQSKARKRPKTVGAQMDRSRAGLMKTSSVEGLGKRKKTKNAVARKRPGTTTGFSRNALSFKETRGKNTKVLKPLDAAGRFGVERPQTRDGFLGAFVDNGNLRRPPQTSQGFRPHRSKNKKNKTKEEHLSKFEKECLRVVEKDLDLYVQAFSSDKLEWGTVITDLQGQEVEDSFHQIQVVKALIACAVHRPQCLPIFAAPKFLGHLWDATEQAKSPLLPLLTLRFVREAAAIGEPWFRVLLEHDVLGKLARWAHGTVLSAHFMEEDLLAQWSPPPKQQERKYDVNVDALMLGQITRKELRSHIYYSVKKMGARAIAYSPPGVSRTSARSFFVRCGGYFLLLTLGLQQQKDSNLDHLSMEYHEIIHLLVQKCGFDLETDEKETRLCISKCFKVKRAEMADQAMMDALGLRNKSDSSLTSVSTRLESPYSQFQNVLEGCHYQHDKEEALRLFERIRVSYDRVERREQFRKTCLLEAQNPDAVLSRLKLIEK